MKLVVQIPCLNEAATLPLVLADIPKKIPGIASIAILVIDDGSTDGTSQVAREHGVKHIIRHTKNMGLGRSFHDGAMRALELGADIVVNTDGDNQFPQADIARLVQPIIHGEADLVVADRQIKNVREYTPIKKFLQRLGSHVVNIAAGTNIPDAACGFRAYSRESIIRLNSLTKFSYCMETIIQAGHKDLAVTSIPITINPKTRDSRLFTSIWEHIFKSSVAIMRSYTMYKPYVFFTTLGLGLLLGGLSPFARYLWLYYIDGQRSEHVQSLIFGAILLIGSFLSFVLGVVADLTRTNRSLLENQLELTKRMHLNAVASKTLSQKT